MDTPTTMPGHGQNKRARVDLNPEPDCAQLAGKLQEYQRLLSAAAGSAAGSSSGPPPAALAELRAACDAVMAQLDAREQAAEGPLARLDGNLLISIFAYCSAKTLQALDCAC